MKQYTVKLAEIDRFRAGNRRPTVGYGGMLDGPWRRLWDKPVTLERDDANPGVVIVHDGEGEPMGILPRRGNLCKAIIAGARVGYASWAGIGVPDGDGCPTSLRVRVVLVDEGEHFELPPTTPPHSWPVGIVGESHYQAAIARCSPGERVEVLREPDNPYDSLALTVVTAQGDTIGYIPRINWLQDAIHNEGRGCDATIKSIGANDSDELLGVVLDVSTNGWGVGERAFSRVSETSAEPSRKGWLARLLGF